MTKAITLDVFGLFKQTFETKMMDLLEGDKAEDNRDDLINLMIIVAGMLVNRGVDVRLALSEREFRNLSNENFVRTIEYFLRELYQFFFI